MNRRDWVSAWATLLLVTTACGPTPGSRDGPSPVRGAIVGGEKTSDWPAVGALVADVPGYGYMGPFCTGTLIAPRWVLTAAHCISSYQGMPILPFFVKFYVGTDANASWGGTPPAGQLYQADEFFPHPDYDSSMLTVGHDIGLVRLKTDVPGVEPVTINRRSLRGQHLGAAVVYVGFGVSNGVQQTGSGVKRMTTVPLTWFDTGAYYGEPEGSGTCHGDSGGPGLLQMDQDGTWSQIGVVSAGTESPTTPGDPCLTGIGIYTRVDTHAAWIAEVTGLTFSSCAQGVCLCDDGCRPDGTCDDAVCRIRTCLQSLVCLSGCASGDDACRMDCRTTTRLEDVVAFDKIQYCLATKCSDTVDSLGCAQSACADRLAECVARSGTDATCAAYAACREACVEGDALCLFACDSGATEGARAAWTAADTCLRQADCPVLVTPLAAADPCAREHCLSALDACFPPPPCDPLGGTCAEGAACRLLPDGQSRCVASEGRLQGDACDPASPAPCADGLWCVGDGADAACRRACREDQDCDGAERCERPERAGPDALGACRPPQPPDSSPDTPAANDVVQDASEPSSDETQAGETTRPDLADGGPGVRRGSGGGCATRSVGSIPWPLAFMVVAGLAARRATRPAPRS